MGVVKIVMVKKLNRKNAHLKLLPLMVEKIVMAKKLNRKNAHLKPSTVDSVNGVIGLYVGITMNSKPETENVTLQHPLMVEKIVMEKKLNKKNAHLKLLPSMEDLVNGVHGLNVHQNRRTAQMMNSKPE